MYILRKAFSLPVISDYLAVLFISDKFTLINLKYISMSFFIYAVKNKNRSLTTYTSEKAFISFNYFIFDTFKLQCY